MRLTRATLVAVLIAALGAVSASGASAAQLLVLRYGAGSALVPAGTTMYVEVRLGAEQCYGLGGVYALEANGKSTDTISEKTAYSPSCAGSGESLSGAITRVKLEGTGKGVWEGSNVVYREPGPCVYAFKKFETTEELYPGDSAFAGAGTGDLDKADSTSGCSASRTVSFVGTISASFAFEPLYVESFSASTPVDLKAGGALLKSRSGLGLELGVQVSAGNACILSQNGSLKANGKPTDAATFNEAGEPAICEIGENLVTGSVQEARLTNLGKLTLTAKTRLAVTTPGPCVYEAASLTGLLVLPTAVQTIVSADGTLDSALSSKACAATGEIEGEATIRGTGRDILEAAI